MKIESTEVSAYSKDCRPYKSTSLITRISFVNAIKLSQINYYRNISLHIVRLGPFLKNRAR